MNDLPPISEEEERVWRFLLAHRDAPAADVAVACGVTPEFVRSLIARIGSPNWQAPVETRHYNVGDSDYAKYKIQNWDIWLEYRLNPWDADIIKRVLRRKPGQRRSDYEKIKHVCDERIRQIDAGLDEETPHASLDQEEGPNP